MTQKRNNSKSSVENETNDARTLLTNTKPTTILITDTTPDVTPDKNPGGIVTIDNISLNDTPNDTS